MNRKVQRYSVGAVARIIGCAESTVRRYHAEGIAEPEIGNGGKRLFSDRDIERMKKHRAQNGIV